MQGEHTASSVACIAVAGRKVLVAHRNPVGQMGGRWEFPGGKLEAGESYVDAAVREFREEFGVDISVGEELAEAVFIHNDASVSLHAYRVFVPHDGMTVSYTLTEHSEYKWVEISEIETLSFVDSDMKLYPAVRRYVEAL